MSKLAHSIHEPSEPPFITALKHDGTKEDMKELADFIAQQNCYHSNSIASDDPIIKAHIEKLIVWERLVRSFGTNDSAPFITALKTGGTKEEAIFALERMWEENNALLKQIKDAGDACIQLAAKHGYATGHGDTVADMINEISAQISEKVRA